MDCFDNLKEKEIDIIISNSAFNINYLGIYIAHFLTLFYGEKFVFTSAYDKENDLVYKYVVKDSEKVIVINSENKYMLAKEDVEVLDISKSNVIKDNVNIYAKEDGLLLVRGKLSSIVQEFINELINTKVTHKELNNITIIESEYKLLNKYYNKVKENYDLLYESKKKTLLKNLNNEFQEKFLELNRVLTNNK